MSKVHGDLEGTSFIQNIKRDLYERKKGRFMVVTGAPGDGKSFMALRMAEVLDKNFTLDNVAIAKSTDFLKLLQRGLTGDLNSKILLLDESGAGLGSREWNTAQNRILSVIFQVIRKLGLLIILTIPTWNMLDINARRVCSIYAHAQGVDYEKKLSVFKIYHVSYIDMFGEIKYRKIEDENGTKIDNWGFTLPQTIDLDEYERKKDEAIGWLFDRAEGVFADLEESHQKKESSMMTAERMLRDGHSVLEVADALGSPITNVKKYESTLRSVGALSQ